MRKYFFLLLFKQMLFIDLYDLSIPVDSQNVCTVSKKLLMRKKTWKPFFIIVAVLLILIHVVFQIDLFIHWTSGFKYCPTKCHPKENLNYLQTIKKGKLKLYWFIWKNLKIMFGLTWLSCALCPK